MATEEYRTAHAGDLSAAAAGRQVRLAGWVARRRDHGGVIFIDLRDSSGIVQVVLNPEDSPASEETLKGAAAGILHIGDRNRSTEAKWHCQPGPRHR